MTRNSVVIGDVSRRVLSQSTRFLLFAVTVAQICPLPAAESENPRPRAAAVVAMALAMRRAFELPKRCVGRTDGARYDHQMAGWRLEHTYAELPQLFYSDAASTPVREPRLVAFNQPLATMLGLEPEALAGSDGAAIFAGNALPEGGRPIAQAYAGHQFGHFTALGDGRAILLGEQITPSGDRLDIQLKGAGQTRFSRRGDGRAALGPMLREYIISEAMHALGIPTTRSLAVAKTGEPVYREEVLDGAVLTRVAASHIRVGTMQWAAAHDDQDAVRALADYTRARHYPELADSPEPSSIALFDAILERQAQPHRPLAAGRLRPWRDEHGQHGALRRNDRLRPVRVHGPVRSRHRVQFHRPRRAIRVRPPAGGCAVEPRAACRSDAASVRSRRGSRSGACHGGAQPLPGPVRAVPGSTACERSWDSSRRKTKTSRSSMTSSPGCTAGQLISRTPSGR